MATKPPIDLKETSVLRQAFEDLFEKGQSSFKDTETNISFDSKDAFLKYVHSPHVGIDPNILPKHIGITLEGWYEFYRDGASTITEVQEYTDSNTTALRSDQIEVLQEGAEIRKSAKEAADEKALKAVEDLIQREKKKAEILKEATKGKKVEVKITSPEVQKLSQEKEDAINNLREQVKINQKEAAELLAAEMEKRILPTKPANLSTEEVRVNIKRAAYDLEQSLNGSPTYFKAVIYSKLASDPESGKKLSIEDKYKTDFKDVTDILLNKEKTQYELSRELISASFGDDFASKAFGPSNLSSVNVEFLDSSSENSQSFNLEQIPNDQIDLLDNQSLLPEDLKDLGADEIRAKLLSKSNIWIDKQIANLPTKGLLRRDVVQSGLGVFNIGTPIKWESTNFVGKLAIGTGNGRLFGFLGEITGKNFGVVRAASDVGFKAAASVGTTTAVDVGTAVGAATAPAISTASVTTGVAVKKGLSGLIAKGLTYLGAAGSWATWGVSFAVGWIAGKIVEKVNWRKVLPYAAGIAVFPIAGGLVAAATTVGMIAVFGGFGKKGLWSGIGAGISNFFYFLGESMAISVGTPAIITILLFPIIIALILFIINSGAYIVPPSPLSISSGASIVSPYIEVIKTANPAGPFQNSQLPLTVEYTVSIRAKKGTLTNIQIKYECNVIKKNGSAVCPPTDPEIPSPGSAGLDYPQSIFPTSPYVFTYKHTYNGSYQDSLITDTITVTADSAEQKGAVAAGSAGVKIGNPPDTCPTSSFWPLDGNHIITQTPGGSFSHRTVEAIDLSASMGTPVKATHSGIATVVRTSNAYRPLYIDVASNCGGTPFVTRYAHLSSSAVPDGGQVTMGMTIGTSGSAGTGPHLHYEFRGLKMVVPYVPKTIIRNCSNDGGACGSIP